MDRRNSMNSHTLNLGHIRSLKRLIHYIKRKPRAIPPKVVFFHIPKCGGSSLANALSRCFPSKKCFNVKPLKTRKFGAIIWEDFENQEGYNKEAFYQYYTFKFREYILLYALACGYDFITGHILFSEHAYTHFKQHGYVFLTMVRDPVQRLISQYRFSAMDNCSFDEYLDSESVKQQGNILVRYFSGHPDKEKWAGDAELIQAIENIDKFDMIAILEYLDLFKIQVQERFKLTLTIPHLNQNTRPAFAITNNQKTKIVNLCEPDIILYREVLKRMNVS